MNDFDLKRLTYNQMIIKEITHILHKHPELRFNQLMYIINETGDYFYEEPWVTFERIKKISGDI